MKEYFFANYRLLVDGGIATPESTAYLADFASPTSYTHTFTLRLGGTGELEEKYTRALGCPMVLGTRLFTIHDTGDGWAFVSRLEDGTRIVGVVRYVLLSSRDYGDMVAYVEDRSIDMEIAGLMQRIRPAILMSKAFRTSCEAGMVTRNGLSLHASLVEKDGCGVIFLGPSGMGKSTQARLWKKYLGADFLNGDQPGLRKLGGKWFAFGMPWDGKDGIYRQASVPLRALVWLEQAKENRTVPMTSAQAMTVMLKQAMMPVWDDAAMISTIEQMASLTRDVPMYHLRCLPDRAAVWMTYNTIRKGEVRA